MDHGSLRDEPVSRSGPLLDHLGHFDHQSHHQHQHPQQPPQQQPPYYDPYDHLDIDPRPSPHVPINPYAAANLHAFSANALTTALTADSHDDSVDPADFYRSYRTAQQPGA